MFCLATIALTAASAPTGLRTFGQGYPVKNLSQEINTQTAKVKAKIKTINRPDGSTTIGDMFGQQMQSPEQPNLQNRKGTTQSAPSGTISSMSRNRN
jgi:hypothetical protein